MSNDLPHSTVTALAYLGQIDTATEQSINRAQQTLSYALEVCSVFVKNGLDTTDSDALAVALETLVRCLAEAKNATHDAVTAARRIS